MSSSKQLLLLLLHITGLFRGKESFATLVSSGEWQDITNDGRGSVPSGRTHHAMLAWNGSLYVFGGKAFADGISESSRELYSYNAKLSSWAELDTPIASAPSPRSQHAMAVWDDDLYIFGGWHADATEGVEIFNDVYRFSLSTHTWRDVSDASAPPRYQHAMVAWDSKLFAFGGLVFVSGNSRADNALQEYDTATRTWAERGGEAAPSARRQHTLAVLDGSLYVFGGWADEGSADVVNDLHEYSISSRQWTDRSAPSGGQAPSARYDHSMVAWAGTLYVFGGMGATASLNDLHAYHPTSSTWVALQHGADAPGVRAAHAMAAWGGSLFVFAGGAAGKVLDDFFRLDLCVPGCHALANCANSSCTCRPGYAGDGLTACDNVDECAEGGIGGARCHAEAACEDTAGSFECQCNAGYFVSQQDGHTCINVNERENGGHTCLEMARCSDGDGDFSCACNEGYEGDGETRCDNVNECAGGTHNCHVNASCSDSVGSFGCGCNEGFFGSGVVCTAANACNTGTHNCDAGADCIPAADAFACQCRRGYRGNGTRCRSIDECEEGTHACHERAECSDTEGSYTCRCTAGFSGSGAQCDNVDECAGGTHACHSRAECTDSEGGYLCRCGAGFAGNGSQCENVDECRAGLHSCHRNGTCHDTQGSFTCACGAEWTGDGVACYWDACKSERLQRCGDNAACVSWDGGHACECRAGYAGDGMVCVNVDECLQQTHDCHAHAECRDRDGDFTCVCNAGFLSRNVGRQCFNIDECKTGAHGCHPARECADTEGSYTCACREGLVAEGEGCADRDECADGSHGCDRAQATCSNTEGSFECACAEGWQSEDGGVSCVFGEQCSPLWHNCDGNAACAVAAGSFECACNAGWETADEGVSCSNVDECAGGGHSCHALAACEDSPGSFSCACGAGSEGDGLTCVAQVTCGAGAGGCQAQVWFEATLALSESGFQDVKGAYVAAVASVAQVPTSAVAIGGVTQSGSRRRGLAGLAVQVETAVTVEATRAGAVSLSISRQLSVQLRAEAIELLQISEMQATPLIPDPPPSDGDDDGGDDDDRPVSGGAGDAATPGEGEEGGEETLVEPLSQRSAGLSTGEASGVAAGILGGLGLMVAGFWCCLRYRALGRIQKYSEEARRQGAADEEAPHEEQDKEWDPPSGARTPLSAESLDLDFASASANPPRAREDRQDEGTGRNRQQSAGSSQGGGEAAGVFEGAVVDPDAAAEADQPSEHAAAKPGANAMRGKLLDILSEHKPPPKQKLYEAYAAV